VTLLVVLDSRAHRLPITVGDLSAFERHLGVEQGRMPKPGAPGGSYVYELGHASREGGRFDVGDYHEVSQVIGTPDSNAKLFRVDVDVLLPETLPTSPAVVWEFSATLNGNKFYSRRLAAEQRDLILRDIAVSLATSAPPDTIAFRLALVLA